MLAYGVRIDIGDVGFTLSEACWGIPHVGEYLRM